MGSLAVTRELRRVFGGEGAATAAVDRVDLNIDHGQFVSVMGPSGCGKSTLLHLLGGLDRPTSGEIWFGDTRMDRATVTEWARYRRANIGFVFQSYNLVADLTVLDNVRLPALLLGRRGRQWRDRAADLLAQLGLEGKETVSPSSLSGGEQQRAAIARALINDPGLILADEPTGALDSRTTGEVIRLLRKIHTDGVTLMVVTHDARVATTADRLLTMRDGAIVDETLLNGVKPATFAGLVDHGERT